MAQETDEGSSRIDREAFRKAAADAKLSEVRKQLARFSPTRSPRRGNSSMLDIRQC